MLAVRVKIKYDPINGFQVSGEVQRMSSASLTITGPEIQVYSSTVVLDANYQAVDFSTLNLGDAVTVWVNRNQDNSLTTKQIKLLKSNSTSGASSVTSNRSSKGYELYQNYPNPFNPETTINFDLKESGAAELKVFNMLGQEVATLINKNLSAGHYNVTFSALNLPSGVYIYQIRSNNFVATKKMVLMR